MNKYLIIVMALCVAVIAGAALLQNDLAKRAETMQGSPANDVAAAPGMQGNNTGAAAVRGPVDPKNPEYTVFRLPGENEPRSVAMMVRAQADEPRVEMKYLDLKDLHGKSVADADKFLKRLDAEKSAKAEGRTAGNVTQKDGEDEIITMRVVPGTGNMPNREIKVRARKLNGKIILPDSATEPLPDTAAPAGKKNAAQTKPKDAAQKKPLPKIGSLITIGRYPRGIIGRQPLRWRVLDTFDDDKLLVVTETVIDSMLFQKLRPPEERLAQKDTWRDSDIRKWLNGDFFNKTFTKSEKERIYTCSIECGPYHNGIFGCYRTEDRVFLLSSSEADKYFRDDADRMCIPTRHAKMRGIFTDKDGGRCWWWLRSSDKAEPTVVDFGGIVHFHGESANITIYGVRPAMVIRYPN